MEKGRKERRERGRSGGRVPWKIDCPSWESYIKIIDVTGRQAAPCSNTAVLTSSIKWVKSVFVMACLYNCLSPLPTVGPMTLPCQCNQLCTSLWSPSAHCCHPRSWHPTYKTNMFLWSAAVKTDCSGIKGLRSVVFIWTQTASDFSLRRNCQASFINVPWQTIYFFFKSPEMVQCSGNHSKAKSVCGVNTASSLSLFLVPSHLVWTEDVAQ